MAKFDFLNKTNEKEILDIVSEEDSCFFNLFENPSEELKLKAVQLNGYTIRFMENPSEELQLAAIRQKSFSIKHIHNPSEAMQLEAIVSSNFNILTILCCPDWRKLKNKIIDMATIKDIIE